MVSWLSNWAQGIIIAVIISTIIELILPNGTNKKYVKVVIGIYILFTIISPIISKFKGKDFNINQIIDTQKYEDKLAKNDNEISTKLESNNSRTIKDIYIANLTTDIKTKLEEKGYETVSTSIKIKDTSNYAIEKISLKISKIEKQSNTKHNTNIVNIEEISIQIGENNTTNEIKENNITENEKEEIKKYLSKTYEIDLKNIEIS